MSTHRHDDSDTVGLLEACRIFGISKSMAYRAAAAGQPLTEGVKILRFGTASRPVYRVSRAQIAAVLAPAPTLTGTDIAAIDEQVAS